MNDTDLLQRIREGDDETFRQLYLGLRDEFVAWVIQGSHCNEHEAADIFQESMLAAYENAVTGKLTELKSSFKTYLFGIGKNKASEYTRRFTRESTGIDEGNIEKSGVAQTEHHTFREEEIEALQTALGVLGGQCQRLLELFYFNGLDLNTVATRLGYKNTNTVKTKKYKCLGRLRKIMLKKPSI